MTGSCTAETGTTLTPERFLVTSRVVDLNGHWEKAVCYLCETRAVCRTSFCSCRRSLCAACEGASGDWLVTCRDCLRAFCDSHCADTELTKCSSGFVEAVSRYDIPPPCRRPLRGVLPVPVSVTIRAYVRRAVRIRIFLIFHNSNFLRFILLLQGDGSGKPFREHVPAHLLLSRMQAPGM